MFRAIIIAVKTRGKKQTKIINKLKTLIECHVVLALQVKILSYLPKTFSEQLLKMRSILKNHPQFVMNILTT